MSSEIIQSVYIAYDDDFQHVQLHIHKKSFHYFGGLFNYETDLRVRFTTY